MHPLFGSRGACALASSRHFPCITGAETRGKENLELMMLAGCWRSAVSRFDAHVNEAWDGKRAFSVEHWWRLFRQCRVFWTASTVG